MMMNRCDAVLVAMKVWSVEHCAFVIEVLKKCCGLCYHSVSVLSAL